MAASSTDLVSNLHTLIDESDLDEEAITLFWGAFGGDGPLARAIDGHAIDRPDRGGTPPTTPVWLSSIAVEGFRGIGQRTELLLNARPGLTLVVGRNGSGKSSFAEGLEALLTGDNLRWRGRPKAWQEGWRNLHHDGPTVVSAEFQLEGQPTLTDLARRWGDSFADSTVDGRQGDTTDIGPEHLGWDTALTNYKPLLSYNELGSMLEDKPSAIYDSMATVLGIEQITDSRERLRRARLEEEKPAKELAKACERLIGDLARSTDDRAGEAASILGTKTPDLARLDELAFGQPSQTSTALAAVGQLPRLDVARATELAGALSRATARRAELAETDLGRSDRVAVLLRHAIGHHRIDGDGPCPVCRTGELDHDWRTQAEAEAEAMEAASQQLRSADEDVDRHREAASRALIPMPAALATGLDRDSDRDPDQDALADALVAVASQWERWATHPADGWTDPLLVSRLADTADLNQALDTLRQEAIKALAAHDDEWRPLARSITAWVEQARAAYLAAVRARRLRTVETFAKRAEAKLRSQRFEPIAEAAGRLWEELRQQSNVSLERVALEGQATSRRVDLDVTVDGTATSALGVMSQGELHALALALFLPRVTTVESPFRFLVVDDPVQAMDPARVDGLAQVLAGVAGDRQVLVLTHDDRLPAACRRLGIAAEIIEIARRPGSKVTASASTSPAEKAIGDAFALAKTDRLPEPLKRQVVPMHCRRALEAQVRDLAWARLLTEHSHAQVDELIAECETTNHLLSLLFFGERRQPDDVYQAADGIRAGTAGQLKYLNTVVHEPPSNLNLQALTGTVRNLMTLLREAAW